MTVSREQYEYMAIRCLKAEAALLRYEGRPRTVSAHDIATMQELRDRGLFVAEIAAKTGWSAMTVSRYTVRR
jgi:hypothetical protein